MGHTVVATRGSFESDQAKWFSRWLWRYHNDFVPSDITYLFEVIYPQNRIVVDYCGDENAILLAVKATDGADLWDTFKRCERFDKALNLQGWDMAEVNSHPDFAGKEGFVLCWESGFRAKVKLEEYKRIHRIIYSTSTRTIWETLRKGGSTLELVDRVPDDFKEWAQDTVNSLWRDYAAVTDWAIEIFHDSPNTGKRRDFAEWAKQQVYPGLLFSLLDGKDITDAVWKIVEPRWSTPFRGEAE